MTRALARELGSRSITVNCVAPGFIATDMTDALAEAQQTGAAGADPAGRLGKREEIAAAVAFLASPQAGYITGPSCTSTAACTWPENVRPSVAAAERCLSGTRWP